MTDTPDNLRDRIAAAILSEDDIYRCADAVIASLGLRQESCVEYGYAPSFSERGLDVCGDCGGTVSHDQESAEALREMLMGRNKRFNPKLVHRYVTEWEPDTPTK